MSQVKLTRERAFEILKADEGTGFEAIKHAYRKQLMKWHPKRHNHSSKSIHNFLEVREAFKYLVDGIEDDDDDIWAAVTGGNNSIFRMKTDHGYFYFVSKDDEKKKEEGLKITELNGDEMSLDQMAEKANKAAAELINEENKEKTKADKRRQKKMRQKIRKRQAKKLSGTTSSEIYESSDDDASLKSYKDQPKTDKQQTSSVTSATNGMSSTSFNQDNKVSNKHRAKLKKKPSSTYVSSDEESENDNEEPGWDKDSAFFAKVAQNSKIKQKTAPKIPGKKDETAENGEQAIPANIIESRNFAMEGNKKASAQDYSSAIELFTKAIFLYNRECKYFGNRAYCYEKLGIYGSALDDANTAVSLSPDWPKGHFRRGKALIGLKEFAEAEASFERVLKIDRDNQEAANELRGIQVQQLQNMGFSKDLCEIALKKKGTVQLALDELLSGVLASSSLQDVYVSDDEDAAFFEEEEAEKTASKQEDQYSEVEYSSLWVGNITSDVTVAEMREYFSQFGELQNINTLYASRCAFINYKDPEPAKLALLAGDTIDVGDTTLIIRYPDRAFEQKKNQNMVECHFWRSHGCHYGAKCRFAHIPEHRGIEVYGNKS